MRNTRKRLGLVTALAALSAGLLVMPATAPAKSKSPTSSSKERKQNKKISAAAKQARDAAAAIPVLAAQLGTVNTSLVQVVTDLGSPKAIANNVNFLIAAVGALATEVNGLKTVDTSQGKSITQLQKQTILATQLSIGGTTQSDCFGESPPLPTSKNSQIVSVMCVIKSAHSAETLSLPASCRSNKTNGGSCAHARVLSLQINDDLDPTPAVGTEADLTQRNALTNAADPSSFARGLQSSDSNTTDLLSAIATPQKQITNGLGGTAMVELTIQAFDTNPDESDKAPLTP